MLKLLLVFITCFILLSDCAMNFIVSKFEHCDTKTKYKIEMSAKFKMINGVQYVNAQGNFKTPYGENSSVNITLFFRKSKLVYTKLFSIYDKSLCKAYEMYLGEFFYELERTAGIPARQCPIAKGKYHLSNHPLSFNRLSLQTFPSGYLKFQQQITSNIDGRTLSCIIVEVQNT